MKCGKLLNIFKKYINAPAISVFIRSVFICYKLLYIYIFILGLSVFSSGYCYAGLDIIEFLSTGSVNWSKGIISAKGINKFSKITFSGQNMQDESIKSAKTDALQNLLETSKKVRIDSGSTVASLFMKDNAIMSKMREMIDAAQIVEQKYLSDESVEITVQISLYNAFAQLFLPLDIKQIESIKQITPNQNNCEELLPGLRKKTIFTGLIINAKKVDIKPALFITVSDENGNEICGPAFTSREFAVQYGMCGYAESLDSALNNPRVGDNPLIIKGLQKKGQGRFDIIVSNADAARIQSSSNNITFLKECRIIIIMDGFEKK